MESPSDRKDRNLCQKYERRRIVYCCNIFFLFVCFEHLKKERNEFRWSHNLTAASLLNYSSIHYSFSMRFLFQFLFFIDKTAKGTENEKKNTSHKQTDTLILTAEIKLYLKTQLKIM